jgi:hypothetical protein
LTRMTWRKSVDLESLHEVRVQPKERHGRSATRVLLEKIERSKVIAPIVVMEERARLWLVDGNRRRAIAREVGETHLPAVELVCAPYPAATMWALLNAGQRPVNGQEWFYAWASAGRKRPEFEKDMPKSQRQHIRALSRILDTARAVEVGLENKFAPYIVQSCIKLRKHAVEHNCEDWATKKETMEWILENNVQRVIHEPDTLNAAKVKKIMKHVKNGTPWPGRREATS